MDTHSSIEAAKVAFGGLVSELVPLEPKTPDLDPPAPPAVLVGIDEAGRGELIVYDPSRDPDADADAAQRFAWWER